MIPKAKIHFFFEKKTIVPQRNRLKDFIGKIFKNEDKTIGSLNYVFCSDARLLSINKQYLNHDYFTDIITFDLSNNNQLIEAEIYISIDRVKENARQFGETQQRELHRTIFHGALHLCGFNDKTDMDLQKMRKMEMKYLRKYFS